VRADAVVVPMNPMHLADELAHALRDSGATVAIVSRELRSRLPPGLRHIIVVGTNDDDRPPACADAAPSLRQDGAPGTTEWQAMLAMRRVPGPVTAGPDDLCVLPYTSGTSGRPRGCRHTHRSVTSSLVGSASWFGITHDTVALAALPLFHVAGMAGGMNAPLHAGATVVLLSRWDAGVAARCIRRHRVTHLQAISTMVIDLLAHPGIGEADLSSLVQVRGGGAAMPQTVSTRLRQLTGLDYLEGYGLTETMAATHANPPHRPKAQCLGIPVFDVDARIVDPVSLREMPPGEVGEIVLRGPQVMSGYWNDPDADRQAFMMLDGQSFLRTGDLARVDEDGYFFMVDRLKRIINTAGFKVAPSEVETLLHGHPAVHEACVIGSPDRRRGERVKALVVRRPGASVTATDLLGWARGRLAAYKVPRELVFLDALPKSASGKVQWRRLQDEEARDGRSGRPGVDPPGDALTSPSRA